MFGLKPSKFTEFAGWYGVIAVVTAYGLLSFELIEAQNLLFQALNFTGAIGFIIVAASKKVAQTVILNVIWALIAIISVVRLYI